MMKAGISGIGLVTPWGEELAAFQAAYLEKKNVFAPVERFDSTNLTTKEAAFIQNFDAKKYIKPTKVGRYDIFSRLGIAVAKNCISSVSAGLTEEQLTEMGIIFSCETQSLLTAEYLHDLVVSGPRAVSPKAFSQVSANSSNCNIAIETGIKGPSVNVSAKFASGFLSVFTGLQLLNSDHVENCMVGSLDYLSQIVMEAYSKLNSYRTDKHDGFSAGEGAAALILSNTDSTYGTITGVGYGCSMTDNYRWPNDGEAHARIIKQALGGTEVDRIQLASNGSKVVEKMEEQALNIVFANSVKPEKIRLKSLLGEYSAVSLMQVVAACCEPKGTRTLISVASPGGVHGAMVVESSGFLLEKNHVAAG